jgi:DNA end-binding protein Ku
LPRARSASSANPARPTKQARSTQSTQPAQSSGSDSPDQPAAPVRSFWSGTITFGLVSIPVDLFAAARPRQKSMKLVDEEGHPLGRRYFSPTQGKVLGKDEIVRGFETDSGKMVIITDEEFESAAPERSRDIQLDRFVPIEQIPPSFFQRPYYLAPNERAGKAYSLLAQTMERAGRVAIGEFVMRDHEYLVAIIAEGGVLRAETLRYQDEIRTPEGIGLPNPGKPVKKLVDELGKAIDGLRKDKLDFDELEDQEAEALHELAARKAEAGTDVIELGVLEDDDPEAAGGAEVIDLMQILRKSLGGKTDSGGAKGNRAVATLQSLVEHRAQAEKASAEASSAGKSPKKSSSAKAPAKEAAGSKSPAKKAAGGKAPSPNASAKKAPAKKAPAKSAAAKSTAGSAAGSTAAKRTPTKKAQAKSAPARKAAPARAPAKKSPAGKPPARKRA